MSTKHRVSGRLTESYQGSNNYKLQCHMIYQYNFLLEVLQRMEGTEKKMHRIEGKDQTVSDGVTLGKGLIVRIVLPVTQTV